MHAEVPYPENKAAGLASVCSPPPNSDVTNALSYTHGMVLN